MGVDVAALNALLGAYDSKSAYDALQEWRFELIRGNRPQELAVVLLDALQDRRQDREIRIESLYQITSWFDDLDDLTPYRAAIRHTMNNPDEDIYLRSGAIEWSSSSRLCTADWLTDYIALLDNPSADLRFWACYAILNVAWIADISPARAKLDQLAAFDEAVPLYFGWQVGREALAPLEYIDSRAHVILISPAIEYWKLSQSFREFRAHGEPFINTPLPPVTLQIDPDWLRQKIQRRYRKVTFNWRAPLETYLLTWRIETKRHVLMGGLHRDGYGIVLTRKGRSAANVKFAVWLRSLIESSQTLYLYDWANDGVELRQGMTLEEVQRAQQAMHASNRLPPSMPDGAATPPEESQ